MFRGRITDKQHELLLELVKRGSLQSLEHSVKDTTLEWFQTFCVAFAIIVEDLIVSLDTGLGKTLVATAFMNYITSKFKNQKFIFICKRTSLDQMKQTIEKFSNLRVLSMSAENDSIVDSIVRRDPYQYDVMLVTYQALHDYRINTFLIENKDVFCRLIIDEGHEIGNESSFAHKVVKAMAKYMKSKMILTATPLRVSPEQVVNQIDILDDLLIPMRRNYLSQFKNIDQHGNFIGWHNTDRIKDDIGYRYVSFTREELGLRGNYKPRIEWVPSTPEQRFAQRPDMWKTIKGNPNSHQIKVLKEVITKYREEGKKGIIYINTNDNKKMVLDQLLVDRFRVDIIDGKISKRSERTATQDRFNNGHIDVLITNITESLNLPCDYIIFYEMTVDYKQVIGRGERGLAGRDLDIVFLITEGTVEEEFFIKNVYERGILLKEALGKDVREIEELKEKIDLRKLEERL